MGFSKLNLPKIDKDFFRIKNLRIYKFIKFVFIFSNLVFVLMYITIPIGLIIGVYQISLSILYQITQWALFFWMLLFPIFELLNFNYNEDKDLMKKVFKRSFYFKKFKELRSFHYYYLIPLLIYAIVIRLAKVNNNISYFYIPLKLDPNMCFTLGTLIVSLFIVVNLFKRDVLQEFSRAVIIQSSLFFMICGIILIINYDHPLIEHLKKITPLIFFLPAILGILVLLVVYREYGKG